MATVVERNVDFDYGSVRSRISWGAILAGAAVSMAIYALLMALGVAVGLSVSDDVTTETLGTSAGVWGFISIMIALFTGGWVTTQVTTGESRTEAVLYGVVLWATTSVLLIWITTNGTRAGVDAAMVLQNMTGGNQATVTTDDSQSSEERQDAIARAREAGKRGSWWAFAGMLASMVAAIGGALVGPVELTVRRDVRHYRAPHSPVT
jgi:ABC-type transport system involved in multi-copper enzyme maturation permease subunit